MCALQFFISLILVSMIPCKWCAMSWIHIG
jgi:hypothetical protein